MVGVERWSVFRRGHESAIITRVTPSRVSLRFFVPRHEMRMCVHATIAAITALAGSGSIAGGDAVAVTASGEHRVSWAGDEQPDVTVEQSAPAFGVPAQSTPR
ncbi:MAG TPA: PhzF family phenazine biosynthesis protein [Streptosporangiaceae bacterium]|jgi:predicted PhzF superfamily epimerase YddE/YHI9|nr:PhzF family phenazine biosynthesis protein [Streptosporangiaceae bacterium]HEX2823259.1 PhzF family phenazine biosynthesis protein [Streptosporangiaceae bacterium]